QLVLRDVAATLAEADLVLDLGQGVDEPLDLVGVRREKVEGDALGALGPDPGQPPELVDQVLDRAIVHAPSLRRRRDNGPDGAAGGGAAQPSSTCSAITVPPSISATSGTPTRPVSSSTGSEWSISSIAWAYSASSTSSGLAPTCDASAPDEAPPTSHGGGAVLDGGADPAGDGALGAVPPGGEAALASDSLTVGIGRELGAGSGAGGAPGAGAAAGGAAPGASAPARVPSTRTSTPSVSTSARWTTSA